MRPPITNRGVPPSDSRSSSSVKDLYLNGRRENTDCRLPSWMKIQEPSDTPSSLKWDYYCCSILPVNENDMEKMPFAYTGDQLVEMFESERGVTFSVRSFRPSNGYEQGQALYLDGSFVLSVRWGGYQEFPSVEVKSAAHRYVAKLRKMDHQVTRADVALDISDGTFFEVVHKQLETGSIEGDTKLQCAGDWSRGKARSFYVGSKSSHREIVLYEKGQQIGADPDWVRLEVRYRPKKKPQKIQASRLSAEEVFTVPIEIEPITRMLGSNFKGRTIVKVKQTTTYEKALWHGAFQYHHHLLNLFAKVGGDHKKFCDALFALGHHHKNGELITEAFDLIHAARVEEDANKAIRKYCQDKKIELLA